jgi:hypothetical protein
MLLFLTSRPLFAYWHSLVIACNVRSVNMYYNMPVKYIYKLFARKINIYYFYSILFCSVLFCSMLFYSIIFYYILLYSILFHSILFYSILFYSILFYFYLILFFYILFCYYIILYSILFILFCSVRISGDCQ